nr:e3 ubiquitin-protein ligase sinat5 [Quercus suber]
MNKRSRGFQNDIARSEPISFAQTADNMAKESGQAVERAVVFAKVYCTKDRHPISTEVREKIDKMTEILNNGGSLQGECREGILWETAHRITELENSHQTLRDELAQSKQMHQEQIAELQAQHKAEIAKIHAQNKEQIVEALAEAKRQSDAQHREQLDEMMSGIRGILDQMRQFLNVSLLSQCHYGQKLCSTCKSRVQNRCLTCRKELGDGKAPLEASGIAIGS